MADARLEERGAPLDERTRASMRDVTEITTGISGRAYIAEAAAAIDKSLEVVGIYYDCINAVFIAG